MGALLTPGTGVLEIGSVKGFHKRQSQVALGDEINRAPMMFARVAVTAHCLGL